MTTNSQGTPRVTFWGAARTVTGSMHLLEANGRRLLLDCGLFQGKRALAWERNSQFPFSPETIDAVILSHAHVDHCGNLPNLVRQGFQGPIFCTTATRDLTAVMLADSAKIQEEDAAHLNKRRRPGEPSVRPLYSRGDALETARRCVGIPYEFWQEVGEGMRCRFVDAGHILGSAMVAIEMRSNGRTHRLCFTGDLGRRGLPILRDPAPVPGCDFLISESTYGGRLHPPVEQLGASLAAVVRRTVDRGGRLLIPAFSLGRTQNVVYYFHQLFQSGELAPLPIFVDSPLAANATEVFRLHPECFDEETALVLQSEPDLFGQRRVTYVRGVEESKALNGFAEPCVIIAASGTCEAGRILHHLKHGISDPRNTILIVGYQGPDTLGRRLVEKLPEVRILGESFKLRAEVVVMNGFSCHADQADFQDFLGPLAGEVKCCCLVHGETARAEPLAESLRTIGYKEVRIPDRGATIQLE